MEKNDIITVNVESAGAFFEGVSHVMGKAVFIDNALTGEMVTAKVLKVAKDIAFLKTLEVKKASPNRRVPSCNVFGKCGGCALLHCAHGEQLRLKKQKIIDTFKHIAKLEFPVQDVIGLNEYRYRNKLVMPYANDNGSVVFGLYAPRSHRVVPIDDCLLQNEKLIELAVSLRDFLNANSIKAYDEVTREGNIRRLVARVVDGHYIIVIVGTKPDMNDLRAFNGIVQTITGDDYELYYNKNNKTDNVVLSGECKIVGGKSRPVLVDGLKTTLNPLSFFQVNDSIRKQLYSFVIETAKQIGTDCEFVDAYSGGGVLSALLAREVERVTAIEIERPAHESAIQLAKDNGISNVDFVCGDCATELEKYAENRVVVLDPPRAGCDKKAALASAKAKAVIYISCEPATLARDISFITSEGLTLSYVQPFDMFPNTANIETVAIFTRK